jgi:hypothetical protein
MNGAGELRHARDRPAPTRAWIYVVSLLSFGPHNNLHSYLTPEAC